jgi:hypothetical protein
MVTSCSSANGGRGCAEPLVGDVDLISGFERQITCLAFLHLGEIDRITDGVAMVRSTTRLSSAK